MLFKFKDRKELGSMIGALEKLKAETVKRGECCPYCGSGRTKKLKTLHTCLECQRKFLKIGRWGVKKFI